MPELSINGLHERRTREVVVLLKPAVGGRNLVGKSSSPKDLGNQAISVQCNGCNGLLQLICG